MLIKGPLDNRERSRLTSPVSDPEEEETRGRRGARKRGGVVGGLHDEHSPEEECPMGEAENAEHDGDRELALPQRDPRINYEMMSDIGSSKRALRPEHQRC